MMGYALLARCAECDDRVVASSLPVLSCGGTRAGYFSVQQNTYEDE